MSLPPHREKDAKAEGRGPPESAKETMGPFRSLTARLLRVPMNELEERQRLYEFSKQDSNKARLKVKRLRVDPRSFCCLT